MTAKFNNTVKRKISWNFYRHSILLIKPDMANRLGILKRKRNGLNFL